MAAESYPDDLRYHPEHDWARIEGDTATLGITWYGQDALGELVHYEPPDASATITKDGAYGEVESVKAVSDLIAPLSGEVLAVNKQVVEAPETVNGAHQRAEVPALPAPERGMSVGSTELTKERRCRLCRRRSGA